MREFKKYKRTNIAEMRDVTEDDISKMAFLGNLCIIDDDNISVSEQDMKNGSPKIGDKIARNPNNHNDQWLVAEKYFNENFELINEEAKEGTFFNRLVAEKSELSKKASNLYAFLIDGPKLSPIQRTLLQIQHTIMEAYEKELKRIKQSHEGRGR